MGSWGIGLWVRGAPQDDKSLRLCVCVEGFLAQCQNKFVEFSIFAQPRFCRSATSFVENMLTLVLMFCVHLSCPTGATESMNMKDFMQCLVGAVSVRGVILSDMRVEALLAQPGEIWGDLCLQAISLRRMAKSEPKPYELIRGKLVCEFCRSN